MTMIVGKVMTNWFNTLIFYPIWDSLLIVVWTWSGRLSITITLTFHHQPTRNSVFTGPNSICLICIFVPPLYFLSIFIHALSSLSHGRTLTPSLFAFLISLLILSDTILAFTILLLRNFVMTHFCLSHSLLFFYLSLFAYLLGYPI